MSARLLPLLLALPLLSAAPLHAQGKKVALLVGVRDYEHQSLDNRRFADNDIEELATALADAEYDQVIALTSTRGRKERGARPTVDNIRAQLKKLSGKLTGRDQLLIALAGHGLHVVLDPDAKKPAEEIFFCPADAAPRAADSLDDMKKTLLPISEIVKAAEDSGAGARMLLVDASWNVPRGQRPVGDVDDALPRLKKGTAVLFSCKAGETAHAAPKLGAGHGVFFYHVIDAIKGKARNQRGEVPWAALAEYVADRVAEDVPLLIGGGAKQTPHRVENIQGRSPSLVGEAEASRWYDRGRAYQAGRGVKRDYVEAVKWYLKAADKGHPGAMTALGKMYQEGVGVELDAEEAAKWFRQAAERGDAEAMNELGRMCEAGRGVKRDPAAAAGWYRKAADKDHVLAMFNLAWLYSNGRGVKKDEMEAFRWYRKAAEMGDALAMNSLGEMYANARGVEKDHKEAAKWFRKAADLDVPEAMNNLGVLYQYGLGVAKDPKEALAWYRKAADQDHVLALYNVGWIYESGGAGKKDLKEALKWYRRAAERGDEPAKKKVAELEKGK